MYRVAPRIFRNRHHAHPPLAAFGAAADRELLVFGTRHAADCRGACWALMLLPALSGSYQLTAMVLCSLWAWAQALETPGKPRWQLRLPVRVGRIVRSRSGFSPVVSGVTGR